MITKLNLIKLIDDFSRQLSQPLPLVELQNGWTPEAQQAMSTLIRDLRARLATDDAIPDVSLSRGLDSWGVTGGSMAEAAAVLSNTLRELSTNK